MRRLLTVLTIALLSIAFMLPVQAGTLVMVTATGQVEFNQIGAPPLGDVNPGDPAVMTFIVDSDVFMDSASFPTRGYDIDPSVIAEQTIDKLLVFFFHEIPSHLSGPGQFSFVRVEFLVQIDIPPDTGMFREQSVDGFDFFSN